MKLHLLLHSEKLRYLDNKEHLDKVFVLRHIGHHLQYY